MRRACSPIERSSRALFVDRYGLSKERFGDRFQSDVAAASALSASCSAPPLPISTAKARRRRHIGELTKLLGAAENSRKRSFATPQNLQRLLGALAAIGRQCHSYRMLVFIDESGDPGFKVEKGASPVFVLAMVIFDSADAARAMDELIAQSKARQKHKGEFKFNKCRDEIRDLYFEEIVRGQFRVRAIAVKKDVIYSPRLQSDKDVFYEYFVKAMMRNDGGALRNAKIVIDGSGDREFRKNLASALRRRLQEGAIKDVRFKDSEAVPLLQLADMCVGAIARSYRRDRPNASRWREKLGPRIEDIWNFQ